MKIRIKNELVTTGKDAFYYSIFQNSMIGQTIVTENLRLVTANKQMFQYFQLIPYEVEGLLFGCAFHCANSKCGHTEKCKNCYIRNAVRDILCNRIALKESIIQYSFVSKNRRRTKWFQMNGTAIENGHEQYVALTFTDITELKNQEEYLRKRFALDLSTGTMNKYNLMASMQKVIEPGVTNAEFTVSMIDFDNFKDINDRFGHLMGDRVLETFAEIARKHIRKHDILGRYGGEEFIFIFPDTSQNQALKILKRIHKELQEYFAEELNFTVTFSAGLLYVDTLQNNFMTCPDLIGNLDRMLYRAKKRGRNRAISNMGEIKFN
jgi:diguanylate cyclase (GGDEF)-like protein